MSVRPGTVAAMLAATVEQHGTRLAVVDGPRRWSWVEFAAAVDRRAGGFRARGVDAGDAVALLLGNDAEFVTTFLATQVLGATAVPLNPLFTVGELEQHLALCPVTGIVADTAIVTAPVGRWWVAAPGELDSESAAGDGTPVDPAAPALFAFSSGSTGTPKGMVRTGAHLTAEADQFHATVGVTADDVILAVVALFHAHGLGNCVLAAVRSGAALVLLPRFERDAVLTAIEAERATVFPTVPFVVHTLAETRRAGRADLASLRLCFTAGAPLARETYELCRDRLGVAVRQLYGCSEAGSVTINLDPDADATAASVGRPMHGIELRVTDEDGGPCGHGVTGEVAFRSAALTSGYVGAASDSGPDPFTDGWFRTGDVGHIDAGGNLHVTGRTKLFISTNGYKVDPFEVEAVLRDHPGVVDVVVVGARGELGEEVVKAVVVADATVDDPDRLRADLAVACRDRLAAFKVPRIVELRDEIPRSALGKILRKYLV